MSSAEPEALEGEIVTNPRRGSSTAHKVAAGAIVALLALGISAIAWRAVRRGLAQQEAKANLGALGIDLPDFLTSGSKAASKESKQTLDQLALASRQVAAAKSGKRLARAQDADGYALFASAPATDRGAYVRSAFWLGVASRLVGSNDLGIAAARALAKGAKLRSYSVAGNYMRSNIEQIMSSNAQIVAASVEAHPDWSTPLAVPLQMLGQMPAEPSTAAARPSAADVPGGDVPSTPGGEPSVLTTVGQTLTGVFTGALPDGVSEGHWAAIKWSMRAGLVVAGLLVAKSFWGPSGSAPSDEPPKLNMGDMARAFGRLQKRLEAA